MDKWVENGRDFNAEESVETETYLCCFFRFASHKRRRERNKISRPDRRRFCCDYSELKPGEDVVEEEKVCLIKRTENYWAGFSDIKKSPRMPLYVINKRPDSMRMCGNSV